MPARQLFGHISLAVVVFVVVLAGCTMPLSADSPTEPTPTPTTTTPAPTTTTTAANPTTTPAATTGGPAALPPGVSASGGVNPGVLAAAHRDSLHRTGFRLTEINTTSQRTYVATANATTYRVTPGPTTSTPAIWANDSLVLTTDGGANESGYTRRPRTDNSAVQLTAVGALETLFDAATYTPNGTAACGARECTILTATNSTQFEQFSARALVHTSGTVHQLHASYTTTNESGHPTRAEYHLVLHERGVSTVAPPPWRAAALANTSQ